MGGISGRSLRGTLRQSDLLAVAMPPGPAWPGILTEAWSAGAAVLPVDDRLPREAAADLVRRARPAAVLDGDGLVRHRDGIPVEAGVALVMATSGTSSASKLVELSSDSLGAAVSASAQRLGCGDDDPWLSCLPVAHMGGMLVVLRATLLGSPVDVRGSFETDAFAQAQRRPEPRFTSIVPTMLRRLLDADVDLSGFGAILVGGAPMDLALRARAREAGANVLQTYGLTESCGGVVYDGRALPGVDVRVEGDDDQVLVGGPTIMRGYRFDAEGTAAAFDGGWLRTRDVGEIDADGRLRVHGRLDDLINTGGEKVWPQEVEAALRTHPRVADVMVTGVPDPEWGERVVAFVVPAEPGAGPTLQELRTHAAGRVPRHALPKDVVITGELPRTASGKLVRRAAPDRPPS